MYILYLYYFLIIVVGCADLKPPENAWYQRSGDEVTIECKHQKKSWHLHCDGNRWNGVVGNCNSTGKSHFYKYLEV